MRKSKFTEEQIALALRQAEVGTLVGAGLPEARDHGVDVLPVAEEVRGPRGPGASGAPTAPAGPNSPTASRSVGRSEQ